jgi:hypothetical protein
MQLNKMITIAALLISSNSMATIYHVSISGRDDTGDGSSTNPWRTLMHTVTRVHVSQGDTVQLGAGTFVENGLVEIPLGVNIFGAGIDITTLKAASTFYYHPTDPGYSTDKFLISLNQVNPSAGNQILKNFSIDGDSKQLHGGIYVRYRSNIVIDGVSVKNTNFSGIWLVDVQNSRITNSQLLNCSWGSAGYSAGALNLANLNHVEISNLDVNENTGYGIKALGPYSYNDIFNLKIHDCRVSVDPFGLWNNGSTSNIAIELWSVDLMGCEIYNNYVDNTISLVNRDAIPSRGIQTMHLHDNTLDLQTRAKGNGYGLELTIHDAEVDHNYFIGGNYGIANWSNPMKNWNIHHNVFYAIEGTPPGEILRSEWSGLHNVKFCNNTIEFANGITTNMIGLYSGVSDSLEIANNLLINKSTTYNNYPNEIIHTANGATIGHSLQVLKNSAANMALGDLLTLLLNVFNPLLSLMPLSNPSIAQTGSRPTPYYMPAPGSSLINSGLNVGYPYLGSAPDIGAYEYGWVSDATVETHIFAPIDHSSFIHGTTVNIAAAVSGVNGTINRTINKVDFYEDSRKVGEDLDSPYSCVWAPNSPGTYPITAVATDNAGMAVVSPVIFVTILGAENGHDGDHHNNSFALYPNPASNNFIIAYTASVEEQGEILIFDLSSRFRIHYEVSILPGENTYNINTSTLSCGMYVVMFRPSKGRKFSSRLLIQR